jgi:hypothetical protein
VNPIIKEINEKIKVIKKENEKRKAVITPASRRGRGVYCFTPVRPSVRPRYF